MKFKEAKTIIQKLEDNQINKDYLLKSSLCVSKDEKYRIVYTPFEYVNKQTKVVLIGITPGWTQLINSYRAVREGKSKKDIKKIAAFSGSIRKVLIKSMNSIWPKGLYGVQNCEEFFADKSNLVHCTSLLKDAVFVNNKKNDDFKDAQKIWENKILYNEFKENFLNECENLPKDLILVCLGDKVFNVINKASEKKLLKQENIIFIPHPSGRSQYNSYYFKTLDEITDKYKQYEKRKQNAKKVLKELLKI